MIWYLLIGLAAGWIANLIVNGSGSGLVINLIVGVIGGFLGGWIVEALGWLPVGTFGTFLTSVIGAVVLLLLVSLITRPRRN
ncbi:MAG: GlsB/YeaQ/YmgE family stress response membrane protein [Alistipes sp.]|nr:GlsB/YeaQ/YmgE family stress response membrane protein [Alistipes sp.]